MSTLDPPFRGYIETTFDALLVFEAAKRGMIPRVTRRLIERERGMVQSGAVFVFDEQESGIKRWTDGLTWSPSRILGNFLVYRETDKPPSAGTSSSPTPAPAPADFAPPLGQGALQRPRSTSEGGGDVDRQRERQLVGSLTNSYKFKDNGLVKKTMSVTVNGYTQHMISYYCIEDVTAGRLRTPSTILELAALEISPDYLARQNFRFPPQIEVGPDGVPRYRGEIEDPNSPQSPTQGYYLPPDGYQYGQPPQSAGPSVQRFEPSPGNRSRPLPSGVAPIPIPVQQSHSYPQYPAPDVQRDATRPPRSSGRRYDPYTPTSPRSISGGPGALNQGRRPSQAPAPYPREYYPPPTASSGYEPSSLPEVRHLQQNPFSYNPPPTAPSSFADLYVTEQPSHPPAMPHAYAPSPTSQFHPQWANAGPPASRLLPSTNQGNPPGSAGSSGSPSSVAQGDRSWGSISAGAIPSSGPSRQASISNPSGMPQHPPAHMSAAPAGWEMHPSGQHPGQQEVHGQQPVYAVEQWQ